VSCEDIRFLMHAYADGELGLEKGLEVEQHLTGCTACMREFMNLRNLREAFVNEALYYPAPVTLEERIRGAVRRTGRVERSRGFAYPQFGWVGAAVAAALFLVMIVAGLRLPAWRNDDLTAREILDDHLRSLTANHLTDVLSSNQHTVKPWFDGKLDFAPPVEDLAVQGFTLVGGRLDYLDNRPLAAVVYRRHEHVINLFVAPATNAADSGPFGQVLGGYNLVGWKKSGMSFWAISSVSPAELGRFAELVRSGSSQPSTPGE